MRSKQNADRTQDLSLSDLVPAQPTDMKSKRKLWPAALAGGALLALGGLGWFASSKARVSEGTHEASAHPLDSAPQSAVPAPGQQAPATAAPVAAPAGATAANATPAPANEVRAVEPAPQAAASAADTKAAEPAAEKAEPASEGAASAEAKPDAALAAAEARAAGIVDKAQALQKRRKFAPAKARYRDALKVYPDYPPALLGLAQIAIRLRDGKQAVLLAKQLVSAQPDETGHLVLLGDALKVAGQRKEARETWQSAARKGNTTARARLRR